MQKLLLKEHIKKLTENGRNNDFTGEGGDDMPVVKLFHAYGRGTWLITEYDPEDNTLYGLCDLGMGFPEFGRVSLKELEDMRHQFGWQSIERDIHFQADKTISEYGNEARAAGHIAA